MKKDLLKIDADIIGKGMKRAQEEYNNRKILKWEREAMRRKKYLGKHPECDDSMKDGLCMTCKEVYKDKENKRFQKKRKKKYKRMWGNCIPLSDYKGTLLVSQELVQVRRKKRYEEDNLIQQTFYVSKKKELQIIYKGLSLKKYYGKPCERKYDDLDRGCDEQTIDQSSDVDNLGVTVEGINLESLQTLKQSPAIECNNILVIGNSSLRSEKDLKSYAEEVILSKGFGSFYCIRDIYPFISMELKKKIRKAMKCKMFINSQDYGFKNLDYGCGKQIIDQFSNVGRPDAAAEGDNLNSVQTLKQISATESILGSVIGKTYLISETDPRTLINDFGSFDGLMGKEYGNNRDRERISSNHKYIQDSNMPAYFYEAIRHQNNSQLTPHVPSNDLLINECVFYHGGILYYMGMRQLKKGLFNQIDFVVMELDRTLKRVMELRLNHGRLFYTKGGVFGVSV
jgi:hypothetical protein